MKKIQCRKFTLVELLAAMAVFSILLLVSMQLFSGAQQLWVRSEQKSNAFADARTAMEFAAVRLQTMVYYENMPFGMDEDEVWFATAMPMDGRDSDEHYLRFLKFELDKNSNDGLLVMKIYADSKTDRSYISHFPPYSKNGDIKKARDRVKDKFNSSDVETIELIENVTDFKVHGQFAVKSNGKWKLIPQKDLSGSFKDNGVIITPPYLMEIEISLLDNKDAYRRWKKASETEKKEIFAEYGYTFRRAVLLGQRSGEK